MYCSLSCYDVIRYHIDSGGFSSQIQSPILSLFCFVFPIAVNTESNSHLDNQILVGAIQWVYGHRSNRFNKNLPYLVKYLTFLRKWQKEDEGICKGKKNNNIKITTSHIVLL